MILNRSVSAVSRAIKDGRLSTPTPRIGCCIAQGWRCASTQNASRIDKPQRKAQMMPMQHEHPATNRDNVLGAPNQKLSSA